MKTVVLCNQKGGVGKSAVATLLAHHLAQRGRRVLAIDLDHQGNFTRPLRASGRAEPSACTADALLTGPVPPMPLSPFVVVPADRALLNLERQPDQHTPFARRFRSFLASVDAAFDVCVVDTHPNPDIRVIAALVSADFALSPIQLNQEALDGVTGLLNHERVGLRKIKAVLNPKLTLLGLLPTLVEPTPFQKANFQQVVMCYHPLMIRVGERPGDFAAIPKRSCIAEAQAAGEVLWEMKKTAARDAWREIEPSLSRIADLLDGTDRGITPHAQEASHGPAA
ncbi:Cobyrinic acid ac-diamide synthase [Leptothrix cholodnii SP-6]|uniref:Cobyrinic acid ac-diamide synthase n=1 Tax=Leptothrix cholodnii (strain ATCC 51168 / LMG 8142 / SP-6) TaxID=395495 RepID=B1Y178_LEPCP|nr:ParA family protein [Leptothrix cholodnii]ACB33055.1 Cobyrinic acid ac-diamide synthase [Leptothrix cholodnii SP-6]